MTTAVAVAAAFAACWCCCFATASLTAGDGGAAAAAAASAAAFVTTRRKPARTTGGRRTADAAWWEPTTTTSVLMAKKGAAKKKKKSRGGGGGGGGLKGFGSSSATLSTVTSSSGGGSASEAAAAEIDRSKEALAFYDYLERNGAGSNLKRVGLARFPIGITDTNGDPIRIRGVIALRPIRKGEPILDVPYELAMNLGRESADPTLPAVQLLQEYCRWISGAAEDTASKRKKRDDSAYLKLLPAYLGADCMGSTDFFPDSALDALQYPPVKDETLRRRELTAARYERDVEPMTQISDNMYRWEDGTTPITEMHLRWAVWLITSRVLTVQGEEGTDEAFRLMIPLIDMCNHDRSSPHVLTGRAVKGGSLRVLAGRNVEAGEQVNICYGGGVAGNDRFVQDYGFLDTFDDGTAFDMVARALTGRTGRAGTGEFGLGGRGPGMTGAERAETLEALRTTTLKEDEALLLSADGGDDDDDGPGLDGAMRTAVEFRVGVKRALARLEGT